MYVQMYRYFVLASRTRGLYSVLANMKIAGKGRSDPIQETKNVIFKKMLSHVVKRNPIIAFAS
jgi:hypothetical protein